MAAMDFIGEPGLAQTPQTAKPHHAAWSLHNLQERSK